MDNVCSARIVNQNMGGIKPVPLPPTPRKAIFGDFAMKDVDHVAGMKAVLFGSFAERTCATLILAMSSCATS